MEDTAIDTIRLKIGEIKPNPNNPRLIKDDAFKKLVKSLQDFPEMLNAREIVVNKDHLILGGNMRYKAAQEAGITELPVKIVDWPEDKQREFVIKDNVSGGEWDWDALANEWDADELDEWGLDTPDTWGEEKEIEEDEAPEVDESEPPKSKLGEVYQLGPHRLMCGSATKAADVEKLMDGKKADMVFTDPPYGVSYTGGHNETKRQGIENDELSGEALTNLFRDSLLQAHAASKNTAPFYIWYANGKAVETFGSFNELDLDVRAVLCWYKINSGLGAFMSQYIPNYEPCIYAFKHGQSPKWYGPTDEKTVWELKREAVNTLHPTQKPVELPTRAMRNSSRSGDIVLDLFGGSGSTLIAADNTNRICYMMELDPKYVDVIRKRYHKHITGDEQGWEDGTPAII